MNEFFAALYTVAYISAVTFLATVRWYRRRNPKPRRPAPSWARTNRRTR